MESNAAKLMELTNELDQLNLDDDQAYSFIHRLGDEGYVQAEKTVARFLSSSNSELRRVALNVLINHWGLNQYADICLHLLVNDLSYEVRDMAASCLGTLYRDTSRSDVLQVLKVVIRNKDEHWMVRQASYDAALRIMNIPLDKRPPMTRKIDFEHEIDWGLLDSVV